MTISSASNGGGGGRKKKKKVVELVVRYTECLRNHAAATGGYVTDGCGEFMPSNGSDNLNCSACHCHRNFHRKESQEVVIELEEGEPSTTIVPPPPPHQRVESESETLQPPPGFNKKLKKFRKLADCYTQLPSKTTAVKREEEEEEPSALHHLPEPQNQLPNNDKLIPDHVELITPPPEGINNNKESHYYYYSDVHDQNLNRALMAVDVKEYQNYYEFVIDMPGLKTKDMMIEVEAHNVLLISCERKREKLEEGSSCYKYLKRERRVGKFMRRFVLPENANASAVSAFRQNGLLIVTVEKLPTPPQAVKPKSSNIVGPVEQPVLGPGPASKPKDFFVYFSRRRKHSSGVES